MCSINPKIFTFKPPFTMMSYSKLSLEEEEEDVVSGHSFREDDDVNNMDTTSMTITQASPSLSPIDDYGRNLEVAVVPMRNNTLMRVTYSLEGNAVLKPLLDSVKIAMIT